MELKDFIAKKVKPGEPVTAQAWNDIVEAIDGAYQFLKATAHVAKVRLTSPVADVRAVVVTATRSTGSPYLAVPPSGDNSFWVLSGLESGTYTIRVEAPGYAPATAALTVEEPGETIVELRLSALGPFMPDLFGKPLGDARAALATAQIPVLEIWSFGGESLVPSAPGTENDKLPVFVQWPLPGTTIVAGSGGKLVIASPERTVDTIEVPSLIGLTLVEAEKTLSALGLKLGRVETRESSK